MRAALAIDDWKLPVFRKRLTEAGFKYRDGGGIEGSITMLTVVYEDIHALTKVVLAAQSECKSIGRPGE